MKDRINIYEQFEKYLKGELSNEEYVEFNKRLNFDIDFANEFNAHKNLYELVINKGLIDIKNEIRNIHNKRIRTKKLIRNLSLGFGAITMAVIFIYIYNTENKTTKIKNINVIPDLQNIQEQSREERTEITSAPYKITNTEIKNTTPVKEHTILNSQNTVIEPESENKIEDSFKEVPVVTDISKPDSSIKNKDIVFNEVRNDDKKEISEYDTVKETDCSKIEIYVDVDTKESCDNKPSGEIKFNKSSISGGSYPYICSIDNGLNFYPQYVFSSLRQGLYHLAIQDKNNCIQKLGAYRIDIKKCSYEYAFAPLKNELWRVPSNNQPYKLFVFSKNGQNVFNRDINESETYEWDGKDLTGRDLPMGIYRFILKSNENNIDVTGFVTIIR